MDLKILLRKRSKIELQDHTYISAYGLWKFGSSHQGLTAKLKPPLQNKADLKKVL
jgi:hypothetical protein